MTTEFYTYIHCKPNAIPFYVGKGHGKRAYEFGKGRRNSHHQNIVEKYGKENISVYVFPCNSEEEAFNDEIIQIAEFRRQGYELVNKTNGGEGASGCKFIRSSEWRLQHSKTMRGRKASSETKAKMSEARKGKKMPEGFGEKLSLRNMGNKYAIGNKNAAGRKHTEEEKKVRSASIKEAWKKRTNRTHSPETKAKISKANKGYKHTEEAKEKISRSMKKLRTQQSCNATYENIKEI